MTDTVAVRGIIARGNHGVLEQERRDGQQFVVDIAMFFDTTLAATTDDLSRTVDYSAVAAAVVRVIEGEPVDLIETLAGMIAAEVLTHPLIERVEVTVHKPEAPVGVPFGDVTVTIVRTRADDEEGTLR